MTASTRGDAIRFTHALIRDVLYEHVLRAAAAAAAPAGGGGAHGAPRAGPGRGGLPPPAGGGRARGGVAGAGGRAGGGCYALVTAAERYEAALDAAGRPAGRSRRAGLAAAAPRRTAPPRGSVIGPSRGPRRRCGWPPRRGIPASAPARRRCSGMLISYRGDYRTAMATFAAAVDTIDRLPPGDRHRPPPRAADRQGRQPRHADRSLLAYGGHLTEARTQGEHYLATFAECSDHARGTRRDRRCPQRALLGLRLAGGACTGTAVLRRRGRGLSRERQSRAARSSNLREELILAVLPYQADDLAERERVAAAAERMAAWVVERGGHANPNLPRYARVPLLVLEGRWREARRDPRAARYTGSSTMQRAFAPSTAGRWRGRRGMPRRRGGACTSRRWCVQSRRARRARLGPTARCRSSS